MFFDVDVNLRIKFLSITNNCICATCIEGHTIFGTQCIIMCMTTAELPHHISSQFIEKLAVATLHIIEFITNDKTSSQLFDETIFDLDFLFSDFFHLATSQYQTYHLKGLLPFSVPTCIYEL